MNECYFRKSIKINSKGTINNCSIRESISDQNRSLSIFTNNHYNHMRRRIIETIIPIIINKQTTLQQTSKHPLLSATAGKKKKLCKEITNLLLVKMSQQRLKSSLVVLVVISLLAMLSLSNLVDANHYANGHRQHGQLDQKQQSDSITTINTSNNNNRQYTLQEALIQLTTNTQGIKALDLKLEEPDFLEPIGNHTIPAGRDAQLSCKINNLGSFRIAWLKVEDKGILTIHNNIITRNYRISLMNNDDKNFILNIKNVQPSDRGGYMCQINTSPMKYEIGYLDVLTAPSFDETQSISDVVASENLNVTLSCKANGYPTPSISWRREDNEMILFDNSHEASKSAGEANKIEGPSLSLTRVTRLHSGAYLCIASNGVPPSTSKRIVLDIQFPPVIGLPHKELGASIGQDITLACNIESNPQSSNYWIRAAGSEDSSNSSPRLIDSTSGRSSDYLGQLDDLQEELINGDKYNIVMTHPHMHKVQLKMTIRNVQKSDYGVYRCIAKNQLGTLSDSVRLYEASFSESINNQAISDERQVPPSMLGSSGGASNPLQSGDLEFYSTSANRQGSSSRTHTRSWNYRQSNDPTNSPSASSSTSNNRIYSHQGTRVVMLIMSTIMMMIVIIM